MIVDANGKKLRVLAVVPARGGSKGVPMKNIRPLAGLPLIAHTAKTIAECDFIDRAVSSTDHPEIARIAMEHGLDVPRLRPAELAGDTIGDVPVLQDALAMTEEVDGVQYDIILMLQPTSPLRCKQQINKTLMTLHTNQHDSVWTVSPTDLRFHPDKQLVTDGKRIRFFTETGPNIVARQQLQQTYHRNGIAYAIRRDLLLQGMLMGLNPGFIKIDEPYANIDTEKDFQDAEASLRQPSTVST